MIIREIMGYNPPQRLSIRSTGIKKETFLAVDHRGYVWGVNTRVEHVVSGFPGCSTSIKICGWSFWKAPGSVPLELDLPWGKPQQRNHGEMDMGQNPIPMVNTKIAGKWMFIPINGISRDWSIPKWRNTHMNIKLWTIRKNMDRIEAARKIREPP